MTDQRIVLPGEVGEAQRDRAVVVGLHVGEEAHVDIAERFVVRPVQPPPGDAGQEAQRDDQGDDLPFLGAS